MATQYSLTNAFTAITEESGTIQNIGYESVELVSTSNAVAGEGIILLPGEKKVFTGAVKARSLGAENTINVVDFKSGEGGGDDVMTGASASDDGKAGLVPTPTAGNENRFLRGDGTWAVPTDEDTQYQPATTLTDGLMSSEDKTFVEGEKENYRQPSTTYTAGQIAYHASLPTGWYLECTTAGTTGSGDLAISSPAIGRTVSDGTVVWTMNITINRFPLYVPQPADLNDLWDNGITHYGNATQNRPYGGSGDGMVISYNAVEGLNTQIAFPQAYISSSKVLAQFRNGSKRDNYWSNWLDIDAIVAKSLGANGYIKYASGLIMQWGQGNILNGSSDEVITLPITTTGTKRVYITKFSYFTPEEIIYNNNDTRSDSNHIVVISNSAASNQYGIFYSWLVISQ